MDTIEHGGNSYLSIQASGNAARFVLPFAKELCAGRGVDVGCCKDAWKLPGAIGADIADPHTAFHAMHLPDELDYVFSSHCLEHVSDWVAAVEYWISRLVPGGVLFLYLPHPDQTYWKPWSNRKHLHCLHPEDVKDCMEHFGLENVHVTGRDLNHSYAAVGSTNVCNLL
jgi:SAM-dependent methyltransferase